MNTYWVYILSNVTNDVLYVGMTSDLLRRLDEHRNGKWQGFSEKYAVDKLVFYESTTEVGAAIAREKQIKKWRREKKGKLIETLNPNWDDLFDKLSNNNC